MMNTRKAKNKMSGTHVRNKNFSLRRRLTTYLTVFVFLFQTSLPAFAGIVQSSAIEDAFSTTPSANLVEGFSKYLYLAEPYIESSTSADLESIETFYSLLKNTYPTVVENITDEASMQFVGSPVVQSRYIRAEIYFKLGRNLINGDDPLYENEIEQLSTLYSTAVSYALENPTLRFGDNLSSDQVSRLYNSGRDIIWPELRTIQGRQVYVPILYLSMATIIDRSVTDHQIEFGGNTAFDQVTIDGVELHLGRNAFLSAREALVTRGGSITSDKDINIRVEGRFRNLSGVIEAQGDVNIVADLIENKTVVHRYDFGVQQGTFYGEISKISSEAGNITLRSYGDISNLGANVSAEKGAITIAADGSIYVGAQQLFEAGAFESNKGWDYEYSMVDYLTSNLSAEETIQLIANEQIKIDASSITSNKGHIEILAGLGITIEEELYTYQYSGKKYTRDADYEVSSYKNQAIRSFLDAGKGIRLNSEYGDITLKAVDIVSQEGTQVEATNGAINLLITKTTDNYSVNATAEDLFTTSTLNEGYNIEDIVPNTIVGGFAAEALLGVRIEYEGDPSLSLDEQIAVLSEFNGLGWMADELAKVQADPEAYEWAAIIAQNEKWREEQTSLSPAAMAVISIAVAIAAGPVGVEVIAAVDGSLGVALAAGTTSLINQAALAVINGSLNGGLNGIGSALEDLASDDLVKSLAVSMVTAGVIAEIDAQFFSPDPAQVEAAKATAELKALAAVPPLSQNQIDAVVKLAGTSKGLVSYGQQAVQAVTDSAIRAGVQTVIYGDSFDDFGEAFQQSLVQVGIDRLGQYMANEIKAAWDNPGAESFDTAMKYIAHAGSGCLLGTALSANAEGSSQEASANCAAGAGGAVVGEFIAIQLRSADDIAAAEAGIKKVIDENGDYLNSLKEDGFSHEELEAILNAGSDVSTYWTNEIDTLHAQGVDLAKLGAAISVFAAGGTAAQVDAAAYTGQNAAENNGFFLFLAFPVLLTALDITLTGMDLYEIYEGFESGDPAKIAKAELALAELIGWSAVGAFIPGDKIGKELFDYLAETVKRSGKLGDTVDDVFDYAGNKIGFNNQSYPIADWDGVPNTNTIDDLDIRWGEGISNQGYDYEDYLAAGIYDGTRLSPGFKTFDFYDEATGVATSAKTLDTGTNARLAKPKQVYATLKRNIDAAANFKNAKKGEDLLNENEISSRVIRLAVPSNTNSAQMEQMLRAAEYAGTKNVTLIIDIITL